MRDRLEPVPREHHPVPHVLLRAGVTKSVVTQIRTGARIVRAEAGLAGGIPARAHGHIIIAVCIVVVVAIIIRVSVVVEPRREAERETRAAKPVVAPPVAKAPSGPVATANHTVAAPVATSIDGSAPTEARTCASVHRSAAAEARTSAHRSAATERATASAHAAAATDSTTASAAMHLHLLEHGVALQ